MQLKNLECAAEVNGELCFTNAGALFFRENDKDFRFNHAEVVCILFKGRDRDNFLDVRRLNGDIVNNIDNAIMFLQKHLRVRYEIDSLERSEIPEIPEAALREAVVNAVCHRDYSETGATVMVEIYDDRVDIVSPGGAPKGITEDNFGTKSIARNPIVASMLRQIRYIEKAGTGIARIRKAMWSAKLEEPVFTLNEFFTVSFKRDIIPSSDSGDRPAIDRR